MSKLTKNYIYNVVYQIFILIVPLVTAPYLTRVLGATNMGTYSYINSYATIISNISLLGIYNYGVRQIAYKRDHIEERSQVFYEICLLRLIFMAIGTLLYFMLMDGHYSYYMLLYYPWTLANYIDLSWLFVAMEDMGPAVLKNFLAKILSVLGIFVFVKTKDSLWIYLLLLSVSTLIANMSLIPQVRKYVIKIKHTKFSLFKHIKGSIVLFLPQISTLLYLQLDKIMIETMTGALNQISFYDQAEKIVKIPMTFITVLSTVMMPRIANEYSKGNKEKIFAYLKKVSSFSIALALPMIAGLMVISRQFIPWYLGNEYIPTSLAIMITSPLILFNALSGISGSQYFVATNNIKIVVISNSLAAVFNILLNSILIPNYGYIGAAISTLLASLLIVCIQYTALNKDYSVWHLLESAPKYLLNSVVMFIVVYLTTSHMSCTPITTLVQITIGIVVYVVLLVIERDSLIKLAMDFIKVMKR